MAKRQTQEVQMIEPKSATNVVQSFAVQVPMVDPPGEDYVATQMGRLELQLNRQSELPGFRRLHAGLRASNVVMTNGKRVESAADVIRWIMQQLTSGAA